MPYEWQYDKNARTARLHLWPYRSLPKRGFVAFIGTTATLLLVPLLAVLGKAVLWGILPFLLIAIGGLWWGLSRNYEDGGLIEDLQISEDHIRLTRHNPRGPLQEWQSKTYWTTARLHPTQGPVPNYLTLKGDGREVELGAFLSEDERLRLADELSDMLIRLRSHQAG